MLNKKIQILLSTITALIANHLGATAPLVKSIFILIVIDIITGMIASKYYRGVDLTTKRFKGKLREMGLFAIGLTAFIVSDHAFTSVGLDKLLAAKFYCSAYSFYELFSIIENLGDMGFPIASNIKLMLKSKIDKSLLPLDKEEQND